MLRIGTASIIAIIVLFLGYVFFGDQLLPQPALVDDGVKLYRVSFDGNETDRAYLHVPFKNDRPDARYVNIGLDLDGDGAINVLSDELVVRNAMPIVSVGENLRVPLYLPDRSIGRERPTLVAFFFSREPLAPEALASEAALGDYTLEKATINEVVVDHMDTVLAIDEVGNKRTGSAAAELSAFVLPRVAYAQEGDRPLYYRADHDGVPDHDQDYNECSPTSVVNSFMWLSKQYGFEELMPADIETAISELKADLQWDSGTNDQDIIPGKQQFVDRHQLPIEVHQIGTQNDPDIHYKIYEEIAKGQAVEVSLQFYRTDEDGHRTRAGGHMVSVTGVNGGPEWKGMRLNDSATDAGESDPSGDLYEVQGNQLIGFWTDKDVEIEYAYAQSPIKEVTDGSWTAPSGSDFLVPDTHVLNPGGDVVSKGISRFGFFNSFIDHPGDHYVGERFTVTASVVRRAGERQYMFFTNQAGESDAYWHSAGAPWTLDGTITGGGVLAPDTLVGRPTKATVSGDRYRLEQEFVCVAPGLAMITYQADVTWTIEDGGDPLPADTRTRYEEQLKPQDSFTITSPIFQCLTNDPKDIQETAMSLDEPEPETVCNGITEDPQGVEIEVLEIGGECYPKIQFTEGSSADPCQALHWHGGKVVSLSGTEKMDPLPDACGFGKIGEVPERTVNIDQAAAARYLGGVFDDPLPEPASVEYEFTDDSFKFDGYSDGYQYEADIDFGTIESDESTTEAETGN